MRAPISSLKIVPVLLALNPYHLGETLFLTVAPTLGSSEPLRGKNARCSTLGTRAVSPSGTMWYRLSTAFTSRLAIAANIIGR